MTGGRVSDDFADIIVEAIFTRDLSRVPTSLFFGLSLELPTDQNGTDLVEPTPAEYSRVEVAMTDISWISAGVGSRMMTTDIDITYEMAVVDWGEVHAYPFYDALTDGIFLGYGLLNPYTILAGMIPRLPAGSVSVTLPV